MNASVIYPLLKCFNLIKKIFIKFYSDRLHAAACSSSETELYQFIIRDGVVQNKLLNLA